MMVSFRKFQILYGSVISTYFSYFDAQILDELIHVYKLESFKPQIQEANLRVKISMRKVYNRTLQLSILSCVLALFSIYNFSSFRIEYLKSVAPFQHYDSLAYGLLIITITQTLVTVGLFKDVIRQYQKGGIRITSTMNQTWFFILTIFSLPYYFFSLYQPSLLSIEVNMGSLNIGVSRILSLSILMFSIGLLGISYLGLMNYYLKKFSKAIAIVCLMKVLNLLRRHDSVKIYKRDLVVLLGCICQTLPRDLNPELLQIEAELENKFGIKKKIANHYNLLQLQILYPVSNTKETMRNHILRQFICIMNGNYGKLSKSEQYVLKQVKQKGRLGNIIAVIIIDLILGFVLVIAQIQTGWLNFAWGVSMLPVIVGVLISVTSRVVAGRKVELYGIVDNSIGITMDH